MSIRSPAALRILAVAAQLGLVVLIVASYKLENRGFLHLLILACAGFPVHALLPTKWKLPFFTGLSVAGIVLVLGWAHAAVLGAVGLGLVGVCHLPIVWSARVGLLIAVGVTLAVARSQGIGPDAVWPILASMFMFRLIVYVEALRHSREATCVWRSLAYFFMLPNVCFPLFPVVDFKKFRHSSRNAPDLYQRGVEWILRGLVHLLIYRLVYRYLTVDPETVTGTVDLLRYLLGAFPLYLQVSGTFHLIVGLLALFGFDLPPTHDRYFLASGLTDFWRRINIYWKDFMARIVFYPCHDRLRGLGPTAALALATLAVFVASWLLHAYQSFWLTGAAFWSWNDFLFWMILGLGMVVAVVWEDRRRGRPPATGTARGLRIAATFLSISVLWSMWTADSLDQWLSLWTVAPWLGWTLALLVLGLVAVSLAVEPRAAARRLTPSSGRGSQRSFRSRALRTAAAFSLILAVGSPYLDGRLGSRPAEIVETMTSPRLNSREARMAIAGYYERLSPVGLRNPALRELYTGRPDDWQRLAGTELWRPRQDLLAGELAPSQNLIFKRAELSTNRWGMRGPEIDRAKPAATRRIAFLGSSHTMGSGVGDDETFVRRFDTALEADGTLVADDIEVLNFAVAGYSAIQNLVQLDTVLSDFEPDVVVTVGHTHDVDKNVRFLASAIRDRRPIPLHGLNALLEQAGVVPGEARAVSERRMRPRRWEIAAWTYGELVVRCRGAGVVPVFVVLPLLEGERQDDIERLLAVVEEAGFQTVDLRGVYDGYDVTELRLAPWDLHPNALAHRLVAERLSVELGLESLERLMDDPVHGDDPRNSR